jgi:WD40 repeat protein
VNFGAPAVVPFDDTSENIRGYYLGTPTTVGKAPTVIEVTDVGNATTPAACSSGVTCPTLKLDGTTNPAPKVFAANGFASNFATAVSSLFAFDTGAFTVPFNAALEASGNPNAERVTPDGNWVYVTEYGPHQVAVVDPTTGTEAVPSITVANTGIGGGTFNPYGLDIEPQQFFSVANPTSCASHCSNLNPYIRYDAYIVDPNTYSESNATIEPIPDAENPGAVTSPLAPGNELTVADANNIAISTAPSAANAIQAFVSLFVPAPCGVPPCNTLDVLNLPALSGVATTYPPTVNTTFNTFGLRGTAVAVDPRGNYVYSGTRDNTGAHNYVTITTTGATPAFVTFIPTTAGPGNTVDVCSAAGSGVVFSGVQAKVEGLAVSPDGNRLFIACFDFVNSPQVNNTIGVWDISGATPVFKQEIDLPGPVGGATTANAENGCMTPLDVRAMQTTSAFGTRLFVTCQDTDTIVPIDYNSGSGTNAVDGFSPNPITVTDVISTDYAAGSSPAATPITNNSVGNTLAAYTNNACSNGGSCPQNVDLMPNPSIHFTTGGYAPTLPFALPAASVAAGSYSYFVVAQGGAVPRTFTETTATPLLVGAGGSGACQNLSLVSSGLISGTPTNTGTCGPFIIRVTDGSTPGQFVERAFQITVNP